MGLVDYPSSSEEDEAVDGKDKPSSTSPAPSFIKPAKSVAPPPPLPVKFHDLYPTAARASTTDDPALHGGRIRAQPHIEGHWPSHIYLEWLPSPQHAELLSSIIEAVAPKSGNLGGSKPEPKLRSFLTSSLNVALPLHISLSRPLTLPGPKKDAIQTDLLSAFQRGDISPFEVHVDGLRWVSNDEQTRWFLALVVSTSEPLTKLLNTSNRTLRKWGFQGLYIKDHAKGKERGKRKRADEEHDTEQDPDQPNGRFHFSIAWTLDKSAGGAWDLERGPVSGGEELSLLMEKCQREVSVLFEEVKIKVGNVVTSVPFGKSARDEGGLFL